MDETSSAGPDEFRTGWLLIGLLASLPLGLALTALWGDWRIDRVGWALGSWALYAVVLVAVASVIVARLGRLPRMSALWELLVPIGGGNAVRGGFESGDVWSAPFAIAFTVVVGAVAEAVRRLRSSRSPSPAA